jgi:hypothetical protein
VVLCDVELVSISIQSLFPLSIQVGLEAVAVEFPQVVPLQADAPLVNVSIESTAATFLVIDDQFAAAEQPLVPPSVVADSLQTSTTGGVAKPETAAVRVRKRN